MGGRIVVATVTTPVVGAWNAPVVALLTARDRRLIRPSLSLVHARGYPEERFGTALARDTRRAVDVSVLADIDQSYDQPWLDVADVVLGRVDHLPCPPPEWFARVFARFPGAAIAAAGAGLLGLRDGTLLIVDPVTAGPLFPAFLHGWIAGGNPVTALDDAVLCVGWPIRKPGPPIRKLRPPMKALFRVRLDRWQLAE